MVLRVRGISGVAVAAALLIGCATPPPPEEKKDIDFKAQLGRQGEWIVLRPYGRVWHPHPRIVGENFVPYLSGGKWIRGDQGWEFASEWAFLEQTFHYGRWFLGPDLGWVWLPDQEQAGAWVDWRFGGELVGWSPVPPPAPANATIRPEPQRWTFVKVRHFTQGELQPHVLPPDQIPRALENAAPMAGRNGPTVAQVQALGGLTSDGGIPDLTPPPVEVAPPPPEEEVKEEPPAPPPPPAKKKVKKKKGKK